MKSHLLRRGLLPVLLVAALGLGPCVWAGTVLSKSDNATVYFGRPYGSVELNNPVPAGQSVLGHNVLEWRDAGYVAEPPPSYQDWSASDPGVGGDVNEIWMFTSGQYAMTTTTVSGAIVSVHMNGDANDGVAAVLVDGLLVAILDMYAPPGAPVTAVVLVKGLAAGTHSIDVLNLGAGSGGEDDVALLGAAVLAPTKVKWMQEPQPGTGPNVYYGWNEISDYYSGPIAADDWVCASANPVTQVRWWGSYTNWASPFPPGPGYQSFVIQFWTDVPVGPGYPFSRPGQCVHGVFVTANPMFEGWDYDPINNTYEACFRYEVDLTSSEWFYQEPGPEGSNIYWISIAAANQASEAHPWGWKTRPRDITSPAPDDAVRMTSPLQPSIGSQFESGEPLEWPPGSSWDLAFELVSSFTNAAVKWQQPPDLTPLGLDVQDSAGSSADLPDLLADDFLCGVSGKITHVTLWGSWKNDNLPPGGPASVPITLSIHSDVPAHQSGTGYSMPGNILWLRTFQPGSYAPSVEVSELDEGWYDVFAQYLQVGDHICWRYDFDIPPGEAFLQTGSVEKAVTYWLDAQASVSGSEYRFGWKTTAHHWNDAAVWMPVTEPYIGNWNNVIYPGQHPLYPANIDLSFAISTEQAIFETKWQQLPEPFVPPDGIVGWDELSVHGGAQIVADDWACTNELPVTDVHWWGSYIGWGEETPPQVPDYFVLTFWSDVPAGVGGGFSHPGQAVWQVVCSNFTQRFVGWDFDPRDVGRPPEACFLFEQDLLPNEWFWQSPAGGTNIFWISVAAGYAGAPPIEYAWGWKTRPRDEASLAPDDAVVMSNPTAPLPGALYGEGFPLEYPVGASWDMAFALTTIEGAGMDYGDAPDPTYPTLLVNDGARHTNVPGVCLGASVDWEVDGQPTGLADGDDNNVIDDEDGVAFVGSLLPGQPAQVSVTASTAGFLDAWIDFDNNGSWGDPGDLLCSGYPLAAGVNTINFTVPPLTTAGIITYGRFRFSTAGGLGFIGAAADGEVEDYQVAIANWPQPAADQGDAPDSSNTWGPPMTAYPRGGPPGIAAGYPTVVVAGSPPFGPTHNNAGGMAFLGFAFSPENEADIGFDADGLNNIIPNADASDLDGSDDGVPAPWTLPHCRATSFMFGLSIVGGPIPLFFNTWFDWNRDGDWNDILVCPDGATAPEWAVQNSPVGLGPGFWVLATPMFQAWHPSTNVEPLWMRMSVAELPWPGPMGWGGVGGDGPGGGYAFGETEDYYITAYDPVTYLDFGDAPDPSYPTVLASDGARHQFVPGFALGTVEDFEADGQPDATATGDDLAASDDEDGVVFTNQVLIGQQGCMEVTVVSGPAGGQLDAWVDFDVDGAWSALEKVISSLSLSPGVNSNVCFSVPWTAKLGPTFARFRLSSAGGLLPTGAAADGEVEDYTILVGQPGGSGTLVITNMVRVTNLTVAVGWGPSDSNLHYQVQLATNLVDSGASWTNMGAEVIGPTSVCSDTNAFGTPRFYRVTMPYTP